MGMIRLLMKDFLKKKRKKKKKRLLMLEREPILRKFKILL